MSAMSKRVLITGAGGFIGPWVVTAMQQAGWDVTALLGPADAPLNDPPRGVRAVRGQIEDGALLRACLAGITHVVHLAGPAAVGDSWRNPMGYARAHVAGTATLLDACVAADVTRITVLSSAEVYGRPQHNPVTEDHPLDARSPYGACKVAVEQLLHAYHHGHGLQTLVLRPFSIYGPGSPPTSLLGTILEAVTQDQPVRLFNLKPVRDYTYVADLAQIILRLQNQQGDQPQILNLGSGQGLNVHDLAQRVLEVAGKQLPIEEISAGRRPGASDITTLIADIRKLDALGPFPRTSLKDGLRACLNAYVSRVQASEVLP